MKKRNKVISVCALLLLLVHSGAMAEVHAYLYNLHAEAKYVGKNVSNEQMDEAVAKEVKSGMPGWTYNGKVGKLSKAEKEIFERALCQYDLSSGDVYLVVIFLNNYTQAYRVYVRINSVKSDGGFNYYYSEITSWNQNY